MKNENTLLNELSQHEIEVTSTPPASAARKRTLAAAIHWAAASVSIIDNLIQQTIAQFRRRKAEEKLAVADDETPHEIHEQTHLAHVCKIGGWSAILVEFAFATYFVAAALTSYGLALPIAILIALAVSAFVTTTLVLLIHAGIMFVAKRFGNPHESRERVRKWFVWPALLFGALGILSYFAIQRLDVETLLALLPILFALKFAGMVAFVVLGAGLLAGAEFLLWSRGQSANYHKLLRERQRVDAKRSEWQHELDQVRTESVNAADDAKSTGAILPAHEGGSNGQASTALATKRVATVAVTLIAAVAIFGSSSCTKPATAKAEVTETKERVVLNFVVDASGDPEGGGIANVAAFQQAGRNIRNNAPAIVAEQKVTDVRVFWFGNNGWSAEERLNLRLPPRMRVVADHRDLGEIGKLRRDADQESKRQDDNAVARTTEQIQIQYQAEVEKTLAALSPEVLIPGANIQSRCTDINGMLARFASTQGSADRQLAIIATDGRQNCRGNRQITPLLQPGKNVAVVIILVPGTPSDGREDFELRQKQFEAACAFCVVIPHWSEELDQAMAQAVKRSNEYSSNAR